MSTAPKHTPGPWIAAETPNARGCYSIEPVIGCAYGESDESRANASLIAAGPDLLAELKNAHLIIRNALRVMTPEQKSEWGRLNALSGVEGEGVTRANEREAAIAKATGEEAQS